MNRSSVPPVHKRRTALRWGGGLTALCLLALPAIVLIVEGCAPRPNAATGALRNDGPATASTSEPVQPPRTVSREERAQFAGDRTCVSCHPQQAGQLKGFHARTLSKVTLANSRKIFQKPARLVDPALGIQYRPVVRNGLCMIEARKGAEVAESPAEFILGSGRRGVTYLGTYLGQPTELRISYYHNLGRWDFTPSQQPGGLVTSAVGQRLDQETVTACFACHTSALVEAEGKLRLKESIWGIGCEGCHGGGRAHVEAVRRNANAPSKEADLRIARLGSDRQLASQELCVRCHQTPPDVMGNPLVLEAQLPRHPVPALARSRCFTESQGRLTCLTCHDPHRNAAEVKQAEYNRICASCHGQTLKPEPASRAVPRMEVSEGKPCPHQPKGDCVSCHMPSQVVEMPTRPKFRTHWIKVWADAARARASAGKR